ncbi:hypothetical protein KDW_43460 [Dictyobacter vulcani]|uniref:Condensation domain-containing protein n=1 Tax=Dictyobacter vulcani TaxID=2607529 RepID=A0A5J4KL74_9CHLR|nr:hypothetical protein KDW_43460 [Dictyobacter vulcani]
MHLLPHSRSNASGFLDQLEPGKPFYTIPTAVRFRGPLHIAALEAGLNEIVQRHETLRTTFAMLDGELMQMVTDASQAEHFVLKRVDLRACIPAELDATIRQYAESEALQPFDLARGPLVTWHLAGSR